MSSDGLKIDRFGNSKNIKALAWTGIPDTLKWLSGSVTEAPFITTNSGNASAAAKTISLQFAISAGEFIYRFFIFDTFSEVNV